MSDVGQIAEAVGTIAKIVYGQLHPDQQTLINKAYEKVVKDVEDFKNALLNRELTAVQLMLDGLQYGITTDVSADNYNSLKQLKLGEQFDAYDLLGLFQRCKGSEFAQAINQIIQVAPKDS